MRTLTLLVAMLTVMAGLTVFTSAPAAAVDVYTTPGTHQVNGREWHTTCEPYSQTSRCRTDILATQVTQVNGVFRARTDWYFNNLTYVASPRALWAGNPLGNTGSWLAADGHRWRTDCDVSTTGRNGCRSYIEAHVIESNPKGSPKYRWTTKWVFNNIVRFTGGNPPATPAPGPAPTVTVTATTGPTATPTATVTATASPTATATVTATTTATPTSTTPAWLDPLTIVDPGLRSCIADKLGIANTAFMPTELLDSVAQLFCGNKGINTLSGMPDMPRLTTLDLSFNQLTSLAGMPELHRLATLNLSNSQLTSLAGMPPELPGLTTLDLALNQLTSLTGMPAELPSLTTLDLSNNHLSSLDALPAELPSLAILDLYYNELTSLAGLPSELPALDTLDLHNNQLTSMTDLPSASALPNITLLDLSHNQITTLSGIPTLVTLQTLGLGANQISDVAPLAGFVGLLNLWLFPNPVTDLSPLAQLVADGLIIHGP